jgi:hypothetical protein
MKHRLQSSAVAVEQGAQPAPPADAPLYLTSRQAMRFIPCKSLKAVTEWIRRHRVIRCADGTICRRDIERVKRQPKRPHRIHPNSLANLRKRRLA